MVVGYHVAIFRNHKTRALAGGHAATTTGSFPTAVWRHAIFKKTFERMVVWEGFEKLFHIFAGTMTFKSGGLGFHLHLNIHNGRAHLINHVSKAQRRTIGQPLNALSWGCIGNTYLIVRHASRNHQRHHRNARQKRLAAVRQKTRGKRFVHWDHPYFWGSLDDLNIGAGSFPYPVQKMKLL